MNLLQLQKGSKHFGARILFDTASFAINENEHVGVIGPNGAGKTTLFKILVGREELDSGVLTKTQQLRIGYLEQEAEWNLEQTTEEFLTEDSRIPLWELKQKGLELGLTEEHFKTQLRSLSGGYRMRVKLLAILGQEPHLMLLDEPTNFLDLESILALEKFLQDYKGAFLLISHDREFLRRTTESTLEVEAGDITKFPGHIDDYFEQKAQLSATLQAQSANLEAKRKHIQDFIDRFGAKATKAKQAQSRVKQLEKMSQIEIKDLPIRARIPIPPPAHTGKETLNIRNATMGYGDRAVLKGVNLRLERGTHLGVVGFNGAGKSTLLKSLAGSLPLLQGEYALGYQVKLALFSQHSTDQLDLNDTVLGSLQKAAHPEIKAQEILNIAGALLFSGADIAKKVSLLSGGEKSRVALGQILLQRSPLLLMDEPTNHLDFETVEALTEALKKYEGSLVVVSHDRSFISRVSHKILEIDHGRVEVYPGSYDDYIWSLQKGALKDRAPVEHQGLEKVAASEPTAALKFNYKEETKKLQAQVKEFERKILKCEELLHTHEKKREAIMHDLLQAQGVQAQSKAQELALCSNEISRLEEDLLRHMEDLDQKQKELQKLKS